MALIDQALGDTIYAALTKARQVEADTDPDVAIRAIANDLATAITNQIRTATGVGTATPAGVVTVTQIQ